MRTEPQVPSARRPWADVLRALGRRAGTAIRAVARGTKAWASKGAELARLKRREQALRLQLYRRIRSIGRTVLFIHRAGKLSHSLESFPDLMRELESVAALEAELRETRAQLDRLQARLFERSE